MKGFKNKAWALAELLPGCPISEESRSKVETFLRHHKRTVCRIPIAMCLVVGATYQSGQCSDVPAFGERMGIWGTELVEWFTAHANDWYNMANKASHAYKEYKAVRQLYQKIHTGNIGLTLSFAIPEFEIMDGQDVGGVDAAQFKAVRIRPGRASFNPGGFDFSGHGGVRGGGGIKIDYKVLLDQLQGLAAGDWDFNNTRVQVDKNGRITRTIDWQEEKQSIQDQSVMAYLVGGNAYHNLGYMKAAGMDFNDDRARSMGQVHFEAVGKEAQNLVAEADAMQTAGEALGIDSAMASWTSAYAQGVSSATANYVTGTAGGDFAAATMGHLEGERAAGRDKINRAQSQNIDVRRQAQEADDNLRSAKAWYDVMGGGTLNAWDFLIKSFTPGGQTDTKQGGSSSIYNQAPIQKEGAIQAAESIKALTEGQTEEGVNQITAAAAEEAAIANEAVIKKAKAYHDELMMRALQAMASAKIQNNCAINVGDVQVVFDANSMDKIEGLDGAVAALDAQSQASLAGLSDKLANPEMFGSLGSVWTKIQDALTNALGVIFLGSTFNNPDPGQEA